LSPRHGRSREGARARATSRPGHAAPCAGGRWRGQGASAPLRPRWSRVSAGETRVHWLMKTGRARPCTIFPEPWAQPSSHPTPSLDTCPTEGSSCHQWRLFPTIKGPPGTVGSTSAPSGATPAPAPPPALAGGRTTVPSRPPRPPQPPPTGTSIDGTGVIL